MVYISNILRDCTALSIYIRIMFYSVVVQQFENQRSGETACLYLHWLFIFHKFGLEVYYLFLFFLFKNKTWKKYHIINTVLVVPRAPEKYFFSFSSPCLCEFSFHGNTTFVPKKLHNPHRKSISTSTGNNEVWSPISLYFKSFKLIHLILLHPPFPYSCPPSSY